MNIYNTRIVVIDIGAAQPDHRRWNAFTERTMICFEPNEEEFSKLLPAENTRFYNLAIGMTDGKSPLYITGYWSNSSTLRPNMVLTKRLAYNDEDWNITKILDVDCATLDSVLAGDGIVPDFIKVDTQGSELSILQGSPVSLGSVFGVEVEVEFLPLYEKQPLFEDVQSFMRAQGFQLMDLGNRLHVKGRNSTGMGGNKSNFISADALYFRSLDSLEHWRAADADKLTSAVAVCLAYGYEDYAFELCVKIQNCNPALQAHAASLVVFLTRAPLSTGIKQWIKRTGWAQVLGKKLRALGKRLVIHEQPGETACWFPGVGNRE